VQQSGQPNCQISLIGSRQRRPLLAHSGHALQMSAFGVSGHAVLHHTCPLLTQSGLSPLVANRKKLAAKNKSRLLRML
jgi:hypothetical protein